MYGNIWKNKGKMIRMNQRVYRYISETLVGSVGMFVWKLLKTARGTPRKWIRYDQSIISETELWLQRRFPFQVVIGRHPDCNIQALQGSLRNSFVAFIVVVDWWKLNSFLIDY